MKNTSTCIVRGAIAIALAVLLGSCLPYPLGDPTKSQVDPALHGRWLRDQDGSVSVVTLYPFDAHAYVLESRELVLKGSLVQPKSRFLAKAWLTKVNGQTFLTLDQLDQKLLSESGDTKVYPVFRLTVSKDTIRTTRVNEEFPGFKEAKNSQDVERIIGRELKNPELYAESASYRRLTPERDGQLLQAISELP